MSTTYILGSINDSRRSAYDEATEKHIIGLQSSMPTITNTIYPHLTWSTLWFSLLCIFVVLNLKNMPFMWHMRLLNAFRFILRTQRPSVPLTPSHLFQPIITTSSAQLMEIDLNMHKSNSSYFADVDIARTHLVCTLFASGIERMRGGTAAYTGSGRPVFGLALGGVFCTFRREIRPYHEFEMWSKILCWDEKWIYIVTHFVRKGAAAPKAYSLYPNQSLGQSQQNSSDANATIKGGLHDELDGILRRTSMNSISSSSSSDSAYSKDIFATALSKCVFKSGRKTVAPELMLQMSGLLPNSSEKELSVEEEAEAARTREDIEAQRQKGMQMAQLLATQHQQDLEAEFSGSDCEALGRHTDGAGVAGVVNTLMQLAHVKKSQVL
ncbi:hypothetical protein F5X99DRAFT_85864 [Biscogniauxia marginata]|nr:hypothetical protein F5X99DRAFT_85864 [Biscogniauxia marginata]